MVIYKVCEDCIMAIMNNDFTGLDYSYNEKESLQRMEEIKKGMKELGSNIVCMEDEPDEFSAMPCDCCRTRLVGSRHYIADITEDL